MKPRGERVRAGMWVAAATALLAAAAGCSDGSSSDESPSTSAVPTGSATEPTSVSPATSLDPSEATDPTTSSAPPTHKTPDVPRSITVVMNGDMLLHEGLWSSARINFAHTGRGPDGMDFRPVLADMRPVVSHADLAICHMETPLAPHGGPYSGYPLFSAPPAILPALKWLGYDACTTASNHSIDQGFEGLKRTIDDFERIGMAHAGTAETQRASRQPLLMDVGGVTVGLVSATYGTNGLPLPEDEPWSVPLINTDRIEAMAHRAKQQGADIVMVALHWGLEYMHAPTTDQLAVAHELTRSPDINFIYGHHAHVVQPYDVVNGRWVVYGLGNAVAQQDTAVEGVYDGNTCRVTFTERADGSFGVTKLEYIPTMITHFDGVHPMRWLNVPQDLDDPAFASLRPALAATDQRVTDVIGSLGAFRRGVTEGD
jgi:poly-gamma-glutamate capsule biosynthesis protein CapA/YwtB (metallophosphatase superfamily)